MTRKAVYQQIESVAMREPRIPALKRQIQSLLEIVDFEVDGKKVAIDGFRLKNPDHWVVPSYREPGSFFQHLARRCNLHCDFCYVTGDPEGLSIPLSRIMASDEELETRLAYYKPDEGTELLPAHYQFMEIFFHPRALDYLGRLREKTKRSFNIVSNGSYFTEAVVAELKKLEPVFIVQSLGSCDAKKRATLMRDPRPEVAINAPRLFNKYEVPYAVSVTVWPPVNEQDFLETVFHADANNAAFIRVVLPGYTKNFSSGKMFDTDAVWRQAAALVASVREKISTPIFCVPSVYEIDFLEPLKNQARVLGVIRNSPAHAAGLLHGDRITAVNGIKVANRSEAFNALRHFKDDAGLELRAVRGGKRLSIALSNAGPSRYPYYRDIDGMFDHPFGVIMPDGFSTAYFRAIKDIIRGRGARKVVLVCSRLMRGLFDHESEKIKFIPRLKKGLRCDLKVVVPENEFLGGNIFIGNMLVADDIIAAIRRFIAAEKFKPDLILVPATIFRLITDWYRDIKGDTHLKIERELGVPVELLDCAVIGY